MALISFSSWILACGVYVKSSGERSRSQEIMWPSSPEAVSEYINFFGEISVPDVDHVTNGN